ncbi:hypothetical protein DFR70_104409 [Nocardia tenerifensis]|uniref:Uncharacterized protein n=2 Tax=Nocardia tenerifensis TaxID=228006 RepID=A0A318K7A9_9NOCA|nr:hypothetical protein [Nocardia tenerifensis]PXX65346.1 hypothetical protein DFR70_104409 [Nocardia tenerifensis]
MNWSRVLGIWLLAASLSGCGPFSRTGPDEHEIPTSSHTIQELCDSAKQFFVARAGTENLKLSAGAGGKALTARIGSGNGCFYEKEDGSAWLSSLGYVSLFREVDSARTLTQPPSTTENYPAKAMTVDGVAVKAATEPLPKGGDPATTLLDVNLTATIDGWKGELHFRAAENQTARDDQLIRSGAQVLVNMVRTLKS